MEGLAPIDGWTLLAILAKATGYAAALLAMGGALFLVVFAGETGARNAALGRFVRRVTAFAAVGLLLVLALRFGIRSARIAGTGIEGMVDPIMLGFVWDSPLGRAAIWRGAGAALVLLGLVLSGPMLSGPVLSGPVLSGSVRGRLAPVLAVAGAVLVAASYAQVGHSLGEPRWLLGTLLVLHLLLVAYWVGALLPLHRAANAAGGAALLHRFGTIATGAVALLAAAGTAFAWLLAGSPLALVATAYGWTLLVKVALVAGLLGLAALNRLRLVPALAANRPGAAGALRRSIACEVAFVALVLLATATLTTVTAPPGAM